jgi:hypothetical protein
MSEIRVRIFLVFRGFSPNGEILAFAVARFRYAPAMPEIAEFVTRGAASVSPAVVEKVVRQLPHWRLEFSQINAPKFPHLVDQLEFLANAVEDVADETYMDLPYYAVAQATFALIYAHKKFGIIPDSVLDMGKADDSSVVRAALIQNQKAFSIYAATQGVDWAKVTSKP